MSVNKILKDLVLKTCNITISNGELNKFLDNFIPANKKRHKWILNIMDNPTEFIEFINKNYGNTNKKRCV